MDEGRLVKWDRLECSISGTFACSRSGLGTFDGVGRMSAASAYAPDFTQFVDGIVMTFETHYGAGAIPASTTATLDIPALSVSVSVSVSAAFSTSGTLKIEFDNFRVYCHGSAYFRVRFDAARWYVNGVLQWSTGSQTIDNVGYLAPAAIPLIGAPFIITPAAFYNPNETFGPPVAVCSEFAESIEVSTEVTGGWRYRETAGGAWIKPPVTVSLLDIPALECAGLTASAPLPTATNTFDASVSAYSRLDYYSEFLESVPCDCPPGQVTNTPAIFDVYRTSLESVKHSNNLRLVPDLAKSVKRLGEAEGHVYRAMVYRGGFPWTKQTAFAICDDWTSGGVDPDSTTTATDENEIHPEESEFLAYVGNAAHTIEDPLGFITYAPAAAGGSHFLGYATCAVSVSPGSCSLEGGGAGADSIDYCGSYDTAAHDLRVGTAFGDSVQDYTGAGSNPDLANYLVHDDALGRYLNFIASPHWSYGLWFPPNTIDTDFDSIFDKQVQWLVDGGPIDVAYWIAIRTQWGYQAALPADEKRKTRTSILLEPLGRGALANWIASYFLGTRSSWWGVHRFLVDNTEPITSKVLDSTSGVWTFENCSGALGAGGVVLTPDPGETSIAAILNLGRFTGSPYLYPIISDRVKVEYESPNVSAVSIKFEGRAGDLSAAFPVASGDIVDRPNGVDSKYAASYAQDYGAGFITDGGADTLPEGESAAYDADPEGVHSFGLLAGYGAEKIRFQIEAVSDSADVTLKYPTFYACSDPCDMLPENGNFEVTVWENGPAVRFGNVAYFYSGTMQLTPAVFGIGEPPLYWKSSILDWLGFRNNVYGALPSNSGVTTELAGLFDSYEGNGYADIDEFTVSAIAPRPSAAPRGILVASLREVPPTAVIPIGARDSTTFEATGLPALESWSFCEERRIYVGNKATGLYDGLDSYMTPGATVAGWAMTYHQRALENDEGSFFSVKRGGTEIGTFSPYHGLFSVRSGSGGSVHSDLSPLASLIYEVQVTDDGLTVRVYNLETANGYFEEYEAVARAGILNAKVCVKADRSAFIVFEAPDPDTSVRKVYETRNFKLGQDWTEPLEIMNGRTPAPAEAYQIGVDFIVARENDPGTDWICYRRLFESDSWAAVGTVASNIDADTSGLVFSSERGGVLTWTVSDGGTIRRFVSANLGVDWAEITL